MYKEAFRFKLNVFDVWVDYVMNLIYYQYHMCHQNASSLASASSNLPLSCLASTWFSAASPQPHQFLLSLGLVKTASPTSLDGYMQSFYFVEHHIHFCSGYYLIV